MCAGLQEEAREGMCTGLQAGLHLSVRNQDHRGAGLQDQVRAGLQDRQLHGLQEGLRSLPGHSLRDDLCPDLRNLHGLQNGSDMGGQSRCLCSGLCTSLCPSLRQRVCHDLLQAWFAVQLEGQIGQQEVLLPDNFLLPDNLLLPVIESSKDESESPLVQPRAFFVSSAARQKATNHLARDRKAVAFHWKTFVARS